MFDTYGTAWNKSENYSYKKWSNLDTHTISVGLAVEYLAVMSSLNKQLIKAISPNTVICNFKNTLLEEV